MKTKLLLLLLVLPLISFSQGFGIKAGVNFSNMTLEEKVTYNDGDTATEKVNGKSNPGIYLGINYDIELSDALFLELGAAYSQKGLKVVEEDDEYKYEEKINLSYIEIPFQLKYLAELDDFNVFGMIGPYVGYGIGSKISWEETDDTEIESGESSESVFGDDKSKHWLKPLDIGLSIGAGFNINNLELGLNYGMSLSNSSLYGNETYEGIKYDDIAKNKVFSITLGYRFGD